MAMRQDRLRRLPRVEGSEDAEENGDTNISCKDPITIIFGFSQRFSVLSTFEDREAGSDRGPSQAPGPRGTDLRVVNQPAGLHAHNPVGGGIRYIAVGYHYDRPALLLLIVGVSPRFRLVNKTQRVLSGWRGLASHLGVVNQPAGLHAHNSVGAGVRNIAVGYHYNRPALLLLIGLQVSDRFSGVVRIQISGRFIGEQN